MSEFACMSFVCLQVCGGFVCMYVMITKKLKTKQTNLVCTFVFLFMHECILHIHVCAGVK